MFDSAPSNLPVEPAAKPQSFPPSNVPPAASAQPDVASMTQSSMSPKKEPEDIFSGLDETIMTKPASSLPPLPEKKSFPVKLVLGILGGVAVLGAIGYGVWAFVIVPRLAVPEAPQVAQTLPSSPAPTPLPTSTIVETPPPAATNPTPEPTAPVTEPPAGVTIPTPQTPSAVSSTPTEGVDADADGLTNVEEPYYGADPSKSDTDGDGYSDGSEVTNLYNPAAKDAILATAPFISPLSWSGVSFLAPKPWSLISDPQDATKTALSTGTATRFEFSLGPSLQPGQTLDDALTAAHVETSKSFTTKGGFAARQSADGLVTYVALGDKVLGVTYDLNGDSSYEYRTSYAMILNSLGLVK